jgi:hypothetical protein
VKAPKILLLFGLAAVSTMLICWKGLPDLEGRSVTAALAHTGDTRLGQAIAPLAHAHPDKSGVFALADGRDAFAARALLARAADRSIEHSTTSGVMTYRERCCAKNRMMPRIVAFACGCCSMTTILRDSTPFFRCWMRIQTSRCAYSTHSCIAAFVRWGF